MSASRLTAEQLDQLIAWREAGLSCAKIGAALGMSAGGVTYLCMSRAAYSPKFGRWRRDNGPAIVRAKDGRVLRRFTPEEDQQIEQLGAEGLTLTEIALKVGRPRTSVRMRMLILGAREELALTAVSEGGRMAPSVTDIDAPADGPADVSAPEGRSSKPALAAAQPEHPSP